MRMNGRFVSRIQVARKTNFQRRPTSRQQFRVWVKTRRDFFFDLSAIVIDYFEQMGTGNELSRGWSKVPKNKSDAQMKITKSSISMRKQGDDRVYALV